MHSISADFAEKHFKTLLATVADLWGPGNRLPTPSFEVPKLSIFGPCFITVRNVYPSMHWGKHPPGRHPLGRHPPPWADTPLPVHAGMHTPRQTPTIPLLSACWDTHTPCPVHAKIHAPPEATAADGTHPTGMHSCSIYIFYLVLFSTSFP